MIDKAFCATQNIVLLADWTLSSACSQYALVTGNSYGWAHATLHLSHHDHLFLSPLVNDRSGWERGWLVSIAHIILSRWVLKSSFTEVTLWWAFAWDTNMCRMHFCSRRYLPMIPHVTTFSVSFLLRPWSSKQTTGHSPCISIDLDLWLFLFPSKTNTRCAFQVLHLRRCTSLSCRAIPKWGWSAELSSFERYLNIVQDHELTKPEGFCCCCCFHSTDWRELPMRC